MERALSDEVVYEWRDQLESLVAPLDHEYAVDGRVRESSGMYRDHAGENGLVSHSGVRRLDVNPKEPECHVVLATRSEHWSFD